MSQKIIYCYYTHPSAIVFDREEHLNHSSYERLDKIKVALPNTGGTINNKQHVNNWVLWTLSEVGCDIL